MKTQFQTLPEFYAEVKRLDALKNDYLVGAADIRMVDDDNTIELVNRKTGAVHPFIANHYAHRQIAAKEGIPVPYYEAMAQIPGLRAANVNAWFAHLAKQGKEFTARTRENEFRAMLSNKYSFFDYIDAMNALVPAIQTELGNQELVVRASALSDSRMFLQISSKRFEGDVKVGDPVQAGIIMTNSEVGAGAMDIKSLIWRLSCANGMIGQSIIRKHHVGRRISEDDMESGAYAQDTIKAEMKSLTLRMRDMIKHALSEAVFKEQLEKLQIAAGQEIKKPQSTIENITKQFSGVILQDEVENILANMSTEGNMNKYGLANGITALAHGIDNPDRAYEVEKLGNRIIELTPSQWETVNAA